MDGLRQGQFRVFERRLRWARSEQPRPRRGPGPLFSRTARVRQHALPPGISCNRIRFITKSRGEEFDSLRRYWPQEELYRIDARWAERAGIATGALLSYTDSVRICFCMPFVRMPSFFVRHDCYVLMIISLDERRLTEKRTINNPKKCFVFSVCSKKLLPVFAGRITLPCGGCFASDFDKRRGFRFDFNID